MALRLGVPASDIIFAHPAKQPSHIAYARSRGVARMTFDNEDELRKIGREHPGAEAVLRILVDDSTSVCRLGLKFGAPLAEVPRLLAVAAQARVNVVGVSYHVGSGNGDAAAFGGAVREARKAFDAAAAAGVTLRLLDIGGGYPGSELGAPAGAKAPAAAGGDAYAAHPTFAAIAAHIRVALDECFPEGCGVELVAEPGRFFVKSSHALAVAVVGKRRTEDAATGAVRFNYYVNDGLYGSFNCILYDHVAPTPALVLSQRAAAADDAADDAIASLSDDRRTLTVADAAVGAAAAADLAAAAQRAAAAAALRDDDEEELDDRMRARVGGGMLMHAGGGGGGGGAGARYYHDNAALRAGAGAAALPHIAASFGRAAAAAAAAAASAAPAPAAGATAFDYAALPTAAPLADVPALAGRAYPTTLWGPTCDSMDKISDALVMPEVFPGDVLVFENMGAYTVAGSCRFNGFPISTKVYCHADGRVEVTAEEVTE